MQTSIGRSQKHNFADLQLLPSFDNFGLNLKKSLETSALSPFLQECTHTLRWSWDKKGICSNPENIWKHLKVFVATLKIFQSIGMYLWQPWKYVAKNGWEPTMRDCEYCFVKRCSLEMKDGTINLQLLSVCKCNILELWNVFVATLKIFQSPGMYLLQTWILCCEKWFRTNNEGLWILFCEKVQSRNEQWHNQFATV